MNHLFQDGFMEGWINHDKPMISWDDLPTTIDHRPSSSTQGHRRRLGPGHGTPMGVVAWWDLDQLFLTNLRSTHWLTPSFSTKVGISPTSKHVFSFYIYIYNYIYFQHKSQVFTNKQRILVPNKNSMNYARTCGKYDLVDLSVYTLESSEYSLI